MTGGICDWRDINRMCDWRDINRIYDNPLIIQYMDRISFSEYFICVMDSNILFHS